MTEIIFAIGAGECLVGRTSVCDYPPSRVAAVPVVGGFGTPSLERLLQLRPDLVLDVALEDPALGAALEGAGLRRQRIPCATLDDIPAAILAVGELVRAGDPARALAADIRERVAALRREAAARQAAGARSPTVFIELWSSPLTTCGGKTFVSELVSLAGGENIGAPVVEQPYFSVSSEWVAARNPEVILCLAMGAAGGTNQAGPAGAAAWQYVAARPGWDRLRAVQNHRVYGGLDNNLVLRPGPRVLEGLAALRRCLAPPSAPPPGAAEGSGP